MRETLQQKVEAALQDCKNRKDQLEENIKYHAGNKNWEAAMRCSIKVDQYELFIDQLEIILLTT